MRYKYALTEYEIKIEEKRRAFKEHRFGIDSEILYQNMWFPITSVDFLKGIVEVKLGDVYGEIHENDIDGYRNKLTQ